MKPRHFIPLWIVALTLMGATVVTKISQYPQVTTPATNDLVLLASGSTNKNIRIDALRSNFLAHVSQTNYWYSLLNVTQLYTFEIFSSNVVVSNNITIVTNGTATLSNLPAPSVLVLSTNHQVTNAILVGLTLGNNNTLSATNSGGGDTTSTNIVLLSQTGTNVSQLDFSLVTYGGAFKLLLTNNAYIGAPANVSNTKFQRAWLMVQQPSTGTCLVTFTNGWFAWPEGAAPLNDTNNGSVSVYEFVSDLFTNGLVHGSMTPLSRLP